jgi:hypothetical protein
MKTITEAIRTTIWGGKYEDDSTPMLEDESILQYETRLVEKRVSRCGIYSGAAFCDCGNQFVNHPGNAAKEQQ